MKGNTKDGIQRVSRGKTAGFTCNVDALQLSRAVRNSTQRASRPRKDDVLGVHTRDDAKGGQQVKGAGKKIEVVDFGGIEIPLMRDVTGLYVPVTADNFKPF